MLNRRFLSTHSARLLAVTVIALIFVERPLEAYADPGSGLLVWQLLGAVVIGAVYQVRRMFQKLRGDRFLGRKEQNQSTEGGERGFFVS